MCVVIREYIHSEIMSVFSAIGCLFPKPTQLLLLLLFTATTTALWSSEHMCLSSQTAFYDKRNSQSVVEYADM